MELVSVIIPTYNYADYICEAIESVLKQTYPQDQIEIIVIDDGSTDNTREVLKPFIENGSIQYSFQENKGKAEATSRAIQKSRGKYIFNLDADDYFLSDKIASTVKVFESDNEIVHVATPAKVFYQDKQEYEAERIPRNILGRAIEGDWLLNYFYQNNLLFGGGTTYAARASVLQDINIPAAVDMYIDEFLILAILPKGKSYFVEEPLSVWRVHTSNYSGNTASKEKRASKGERLLKSSNAVLEYLKNQQFNKRLVRIYQLIDETRRIAFKESLDDKNTADVFHYAYVLLFKVKPGWMLIKKYSVMNRFIPTSMLLRLKALKRSHTPRVSN